MWFDKIGLRKQTSYGEDIDLWNLLNMLLLKFACAIHHIVFHSRQRRSEGLLGSDHSLDAVVHVLDEVDLVAAESSQVRDVEHAIVGLGVLTVDTSDLDVVLVSDLLVELGVLHQLGQVDVDGGAETSTHVGGAGGNVTKVLVVGELGLSLDLGRGGGESSEDLADVGASLHGDDSQLILLVHPNEEGLVVVVEDTTSLRPVALETSRLEVLVTTLEEEVVSDQLLLLGLSHGLKGVVLALKLAGELVESGHNETLDLTSLGSVDLGTKRVGGKVSGNSDSSRVDHLVLIRRESGAVELVGIHGGDVLVRGLVAVVGLDDLVEERGKGVVRVVGASIGADTGVGPLRAREDALLEGEAESVSSVLALLPDGGSEALGEERGGTSGEVREAGDVGRSLEERADHGAVGVGLGGVHVGGVGSAHRKDMQSSVKINNSH